MGVGIGVGLDGGDHGDPHLRKEHDGGEDAEGGKCHEISEGPEDLAQRLGDMGEIYGRSSGDLGEIWARRSRAAPGRARARARARG